MAQAAAVMPDCVISGAGPTGLTLALELARRGKKVRIFDRSSGPRPEHQSRALGILPPTLTLLQPSGVTDKLLEEGLKIRFAEIQQDGAFRFRLNIASAAGDYPFLLSLPQGRTERILINALAEYGVHPEWNSQVTGLDDQAEFPVLQVERDGKLEAVAGRLIAGCDGVHSIVRESCGISFEGDRLDTPFSLADVRLKLPDPPGVAIANATSDGFVARLPLPDGTVRLISSKQNVEKRPDVAPLIDTTGWTSAFNITFRHANGLQKGRVVIAGDAAHVHSPAGGRGMNTGIGDAAWLAWLMCENRVNDYEKYRLPVAQMIIRQTRQLTRIITSTGMLRNVMLRFVLPFAMKIPMVQRRAAAQLLAHDMPQPEWIS